MPNGSITGSQKGVDDKKGPERPTLRGKGVVLTIRIPIRQIKRQSIDKTLAHLPPLS
jgi:hypothetical protein